MDNHPQPTKLDQIGYFIATGLLTATMLFSAGMYLFDHTTICGEFDRLGYPTYLVYPLAIAKLLGLVAIWTPGFPRLRNLAYAGFFFNFVLALVAHIMVQDGDYPPAILAVLFLTASVVLRRRLYGLAA